MLKKINESPTITDTIEFDILTPDADGCFSSDPYKVEKVIVYFVERGFFNNNFAEYKKDTVNSELLKELESAIATSCISPTVENLTEVNRIKNEIEKSKLTETIMYNTATPVGVWGDDLLPAWLSTDQDNALITKVTEDEDGNPVYGKFTINWEPLGRREGDYIISWSWKPNAGGDSLNNRILFYLDGNTQITTSIPTHFTVPGKYETLLDVYTPQMFKTYISNNDLTPEVLGEFNKAIAKGFSTLEDLANQTVDLIDANATHESLLQLLSNLFNLKLRTTDPTLWRRQIKRANHLFKKKGTYSGLLEGLSQANIKLNKLTRLWQVNSKYTFQELFVYNGESTFNLSRNVILPLDVDNFELYYRTSDDTNWTELNSDYIDFQDNETITWVGDQLSLGSITLQDGDEIRVIYQFSAVPNPTEQDLEDYIRTLPLMDDRDWREQEYPLKNWNTRLIEEDDTFFNLLIPTNHSYEEKIIFGKVRTEFPYSENIYNMEEYNGSLRDSTDPCDIDKNFIDTCKGCLSSRFNVDIEVEELSNDRMLEALDIINEFSPFHAQLHAINLAGSVNELIQSPEETIQALVTVRKEEMVISGSAQTIFNRTMEEGLTNKQIKRDILADAEFLSTVTGIFYNDKVVIYSPEVNFGKLNIDSNNVLAILSPHAKAGTYVISENEGNYAKVNTSIEPIIAGNAFSFNLSNKILNGNSAAIYQDDYYEFQDTSINFDELGVKTLWDVDNDSSYTGDEWKLSIPAYSGTAYTIKHILPNGKLILINHGGLPTSNQTNVSYTLLDDSSNVIASSSIGKLFVKRRGRVDLSIDGNNLNIDDFRNLINIGYYFKKSSIEYKITEFVPSEEYQFYIQDYTGGDTAGQSFDIYERLADNKVGYLDYSGMKLLTPVNHEISLPIVNGDNPPMVPTDSNNFKESYLLKIGNNYYSIAQINGTTITLSGPKIDTSTLAFGGTSVDYDIYQFKKSIFSVEERLNPPVEGYVFESIDRRGRETITLNIEEQYIAPFTLDMLAINAISEDENGSNVNDVISLSEGISFTIEWADGSEEINEI